MSVCFFIDYSTTEAVIAIAVNGTVCCSDKRIFAPKASRTMLSWILDFMKSNGYAPEQITTWICGMGPGSFTGLRTVAAMISGLARGANPNAICYGIPSALGFAAQLPASITTATVLYDGRNNELLYYSVRRDPEHGWIPDSAQGVVPVSDLASLQKPSAPLLAHCSLEPIIAPQINEVYYIQSLHPEDFFTQTSYRAPITEPIYLRPPVFVAPQPIRKV